jgi:hypothetical protein
MVKTINNYNYGYVDAWSNPDEVNKNVKVYKFIEGQEIWLLEEKSIHKPTIKHRITQCIYRGKNGYNTDCVQLVINGELGITKAVVGGKIFETLEQLKTHVINMFSKEITNLQSSIRKIEGDIDYVQSLKDIKEDRENIINEILTKKENF